MDYQVLFNIVLGLAAFLGGWVLQSITSSVKELSASLKTLDKEHQVTRETYVSKADHAAEIAKFEHRFDRIDDKLERLLTRET